MGFPVSLLIKQSVVICVVQLKHIGDVFKLTPVASKQCPLMVLNIIIMESTVNTLIKSIPGPHGEGKFLDEAILPVDKEYRAGITFT